MTKEQIYQKEYKLKNKEKIAELNKSYSERNKEKIANYKRQHYLENKEKIEKYRNDWRNNKVKIDSLFKLTNNTRTLIKQSFRRNGYSKNSKTYQILGCTFEEFKEHLQNKFTEGMSWDKVGKYIHIDHIRPCSSFDLKNAEEQQKCFHYTNLQPLWATENLKKGSKYIEIESI